MIKKRDPGMSLIVRTVARMTVGFILLYGIYIFVNESNSPGGGFAGGIVIALAFINISLAYGKDLALSTGRSAWAFLGELGVFMLLCVTLLLFTLGYFFLNLFGVGVMPLKFVAVALKVSAGISAIFVSLVLLRAGREAKR
jgi:multisubunit Na+/H+ antiporter MnhB subunit